MGLGQRPTQGLRGGRQERCTYKPKHAHDARTRTLALMCTHRCTEAPRSTWTHLHTHTHNAQTCRDTCTHRRVEAPRLTQSYGAGAWAPGCSGGGLCLANPVVQRLLPEEFGPLDGWKGQGQHSEALRVGRTGFSRLGCGGFWGGKHQVGAWAWVVKALEEGLLSWAPCWVKV